MINFFNKIDNFYKLSMFEAPPHMVYEIFNHIHNIYAAHVDKILNDDDSTKYIKKVIKDNITNQVILKNKYEFLYKINFNNWKYFKDVEDKFNELLKYNKISNYIKIILEIKQEDNDICYIKTSGGYEPETNILKFNITYCKFENVGQYMKAINKIKILIDHECAHFAQFLLSFLKNFKITNYLNTNKGNLFGLMSNKLKQPEYSIIEYNKEFIENKKDHIIKDNKIITKDEYHTLLDIEFYPNLQNSISSFRYLAQFSRKSAFENKEYAREYAKAWIGIKNNLAEMMEKVYGKNIYNKENNINIIQKQINETYIDSPFEELKKLNDAKYKLACKIFWNEITKLGII